MPVKKKIRLEPPPTTPLQKSKYDFGGDREFKIEYLIKAINHMNF